MKKAKIISLSLVVVVVALIAAIFTVPAMAASSAVTDADFVAESGLELTKCPGDTCDHKECDYAYSFAIVGDTQTINYNDVKSGERNMKKMYQWIVDNQAEKNIQYVLGLGDITDQMYVSGIESTWADPNYGEWQNAMESISLLNGNIPYSLVRGNHDTIDHFTSNIDQYNATYRADLLELSAKTDAYGRPMAGFYDVNKLENTYRKVIAGENEYLILTLDHGQDEAMLAWLDGVLTDNPEYIVIVTVHQFLIHDHSIADANETKVPSTDTGFAVSGAKDPRDLWETVLRKHANVSMVLCGHMTNDSIQTTQVCGDNGNTVTWMLIDPQHMDLTDNAVGGNVGMVAMFYFSADGKVVNVEYVSTIRATDGNDETHAYHNASTQTIDLDFEWTKIGDYGYIPTSVYNNPTDYPFVTIFDDDADPATTNMFLGAHASLISSDAKSGAYISHFGVIKTNSADTNVNKRLNYILMRDFDTTNGDIHGYYSNAGQLTGVHTLDLNGHAFTATNAIFTPVMKRNGNAPTYNIINGRINLANGGSVIRIGTASKDCDSKVNLEGLTITVAHGALPIVTTHNSSIGSGSVVKVENCVFDYTVNLPTDYVMFNLADTAALHAAQLSVDNSKILMNSTETISGFELISVNVEDRASFGNNFTLEMPAPANHPTSSFAFPGGSRNFVEISRDAATGIAIYALNEVPATPVYIEGYGEVPAAYSDEQDYPIVIFQNGVFKGAFSMLGNTKKGDGDKTTEAFAYLKTIMTNNSAEADLLLRRDYDCEGYGFVGNFTKALGTINIDLLGNTLTAGAYSFIQIGVRTAGGALTFNVKDGEVLLDNQGANLVKVLSEDAADTKGTVTFTNVKIGYASGATSAKTNIVETGNSTKTSVSHTDIIFTDCHFDFVTNAPTKNKVLLNLTGNGASHTMNVTINGGSITVSDYSKFTMANLTEGKDTLTMGKGSDGKYLTVNTNSGTAAPSGSYNNGTLAFVKVNATDKTTTYELATSSIKSYVPKMSLTLDSNLIANVYIPVNGTQSFTLDGLSSADIADLEEKQVDIDGVWYYLVPVELAANEAAKDILLNVTVLFGDKTAKGTFTFSIVKYAQKVIADGNTLEVTLVKDVLAYVNAAYSYFNGETVSAIDTILNGYKGTLTVEGSADVPTEGIVGATFVLDATPSIKLYLPADTDVSAYTFSEGGRALEYTTGTETLNVDGVDVECVYVEIAVYAYRMCEAITYTNGKVSGSYHINAYYEFAKNDAELASLVESFWIYCQSARAYKTEATK